MSAPVVVDIIAGIVAKTATALDRNILYLHGHPREITSRLTEMTKDEVISANKYPLIALFQDFEEPRKGDFIKLRINMIIATLTNRNYKSPERYSLNFKPLLYPIYDRFIYDLSRSEFIQESNEKEIEVIKIDRLFWGRNGLYGSESNIFNDFIDCIELKDLRLSVKLKNC